MSNAKKSQFLWGRSFILFIYFLFLSFPTYSQTFKRANIPDFLDQKYNSNSTAWGDYDNDGDLDVYVTNGEGGMPNELYRNDGAGKFTAIFNNLTAEKSVPSFSAVWGDYNNDGWLDLYVANCIYSGSPNGTRNFLYKNNGDGTFEYVYNNVVVSHHDPSYACAWADYDNDGWLDLYVVNAYNKRNRLYKNNGDESFTEITDDPVVVSNKHEISCSWSDFNNDGNVDLLVTNTTANSSVSMFGNNGDGTFTKLSNEVTDIDFKKCRGANWGDYNNDGWMDLVMIDRDGGKNRLFKNNSDGSFTEIAEPDFNVSVFQSGNTGQFGDFDNDGDLDIILMHHNSITPEFHSNNGNGSFDLLENEWTIPNQGFAWSLTAIDANMDGYLDIFQANRVTGYAPREPEKNMLFLNTSDDCDAYSLISLRGIESNYYGLGARVRLYGKMADGSTLLQKREMSCLSGAGYTAQNGNILHFGLGDWEQIDSVIVLWPSGIRTQYNNLPINTHFELFENENLLNLSNQNKFSIAAIRETTCPKSIQQLTVDNAHNQVNWYRDGVLISDQDTIDIPVGETQVWYTAQDGYCGDADSILIDNEIIDSRIYPNPANDFVTFELNVNPSLENAFVKVYDVAGKFITLFKIPLVEGKAIEKMPVHDLPSGTYILVIDADCFQKVEKLIVIYQG